MTIVNSEQASHIVLVFHLEPVNASWDVQKRSSVSIVDFKQAFTHCYKVSSNY